jgi:phage shock protein C
MKNYRRKRNYRSYGHDMGSRFKRKVETLYERGLYRSRNGIIMGVCRGIAEYFDFSVFWIRVIVVILLFVSGIWPIAALYFIAALVMKLEPVLPPQDEKEQDFYDDYLRSRRSALDRLKLRFQNLERRIQKMEHTVTKKEYDWESRLNS